jgi:hypothetical protein
MVVPVFITSCHVSLKPTRGPVKLQSTITHNAAINAMGCPIKRDADFENLVNIEADFPILFISDASEVTE